LLSIPHIVKEIAPYRKSGVKGKLQNAYSALKTEIKGRPRLKDVSTGLR
jgi:hypothetical protein